MHNETLCDIGDLQKMLDRGATREHVTEIAKRFEKSDEILAKLRFYDDVPVKLFGQSKAAKLGGYADSDLAQRALEFRKKSGIGRNGNVAVFEYELNGQRYIKEVHTVGQGGRHSEFLAKNIIPEGATLKRLFTERQPCQLYRPNCDRMLARDFPDAEITFIAEYTGRNAVSIKAWDDLMRSIGL